MATYIIDGRLTRDAEMKTTKDGKSFCKFSIAWNRGGNKEPHFYSCTLAEDKSNRIFPYLNKGKYVIAIGEPDWYEFVNENNERKSGEIIRVERITFVSAKEEAKPESSVLTKQDLDIAEEIWGKKKTAGPEEFDDADIPF